MVTLLANAGCTVIATKWHLSNVLNSQLNIPLWDRAKAIINAKAQVKEAYTLLQTVQRNAKAIRESFLEDQAKHLAETRQIDKATALHQLLRAEAMTGYDLPKTWNLDQGMGTCNPQPHPHPQRPRRSQNYNMDYSH